MATKKIKELRELNKDELVSQRAEILKKQVELRFKAKIEKPKNPCEMRELRRTLARINTLIREFELKAGEAE